MNITSRIAFTLVTISAFALNASELEESFRTPPDAARPGVYWYFMDGNQDRDEMVADLHAMKEAGIGTALFLEVNIGVPPGPVAFMSEPWQDNLVHAVKTMQDLGMEFILGTGPGWAGSCGSLVTPEDSMQHLVGSSTAVKGPVKFEQVLPVPRPHAPNRYSGMSGAHAAARREWFRDVAVLAFPNPTGGVAKFDNYNVKTLKDIRPYSIDKAAPTFVMPQADYPEPGAAQVIDAGQVIDLTTKMQADGTLSWEVPEGDWTIMRFVARSTGQTTRPAPRAGHGFECDKFDAASYRRHWENFQARLIDKLPPLTPGKGLTTIHLDSWEMSSQNWSAAFRDEFKKRRGYDPQPFYPAWTGMVVGSRERTERFLWDMRKTSQELVLENHAGAIKSVAREHGLLYSNEPYDMNPAGNIDLGSVADIPACEFWNAAGGPDTQYSCIEAVSIAHTMGKAQVNAEAFTTDGMRYLNYPGNMKNQTDWAFAMGINGIIFHTFQHQPLGPEAKPGMTMGPYGVQWHRNRTMWHLFPAYHEYLTRCSHLLRQGAAVADILYLTPEGAPHIFTAPDSALGGSPRMRDKKGYNFDAVTPRILKMRAKVEDGKIAFPGGTSYSLLVLPQVETMTPGTLAFITDLVEAGATVVGGPPRKSPSLVGYPECDAKVKQLAQALWGTEPQAERQLGAGRVIRDAAGQLKPKSGGEPLLPDSGSWIWLDEGNPAADAPAGTVRFRHMLEVSDLGSLKEAVIEATADNSFEVTLNGVKVLAGDSFHIIYSSDILPALQAGRNEIIITAVNDGPGANPAGMIAAIRLTGADDSSQVLATNGEWQASRDKTDWTAAKVLGEGRMAPWNLSREKKPAAEAGLYPAYAETAAVLRKMGIPEDFQSDGPIRYGHRRTEAEEIYFLSNTTDRKVSATCRFRVAQGAPRLWDPVTAETRSLPRFTRDGKLTAVPLDFEAHQSFFVIFPRRGASEPAAVAEGVNFAATMPVQTLDGPWKVSFDPKRGGPEEVVFDELQDWTRHSERGIKYYSGSAIYRKTFDAPGVSGEPVYLDLGTVHDMARVTLNGEDLGIVWCAPWQVDVTDSMKPKGNQLEVEVVNRWVNRLNGDREAPDKDVRTLKWDSGLLAGREYKTGRYTFSTSGAPQGLLPSGLLGPVRVMVAGDK